MRKKTIAAFAAVYISLCLTYGLVKGINLPTASDDTATVEYTNDNAPTTMSSSVTTSVSDESSAAETTQQSTSVSQKKKRSKTTTVTTEPDSFEEETESEETVTEQTEAPRKEEEEQITEATEPPAIPTLDEYLSKLKCGGCRHGCSLLNPRCMRGARKQSSAESEYYSLYG